MQIPLTPSKSFEPFSTTSYISENVKNENSLRHVPKFGKDKRKNNNFWDL